MIPADALTDSKNVLVCKQFALAKISDAESPASLSVFILKVRGGLPIKPYKTVAEEASAEFIERKSHFIGHIAPVKTEEEAQFFIAHISKEHRDAAHNVFAYILRESGVSRCSDNGEPQGTAGVPTLDVLIKEELTDVCVVTTRYFGGTLLGTGGLVRAYSHAAKIAVDAAKVLHMAECSLLRVEVDYGFYGKLAYMLPEYSAIVKKTDFAENVSLLLKLRGDKQKAFTQALTELSNGRVTAEVVKTFFDAMDA